MLRLGMSNAGELVDTLLSTGQEGIKCLNLTAELNVEINDEEGI